MPDDPGGRGPQEHSTVLGAEGTRLYKCAVHCLFLVSTIQTENFEQHPPQNQSALPARFWAPGGLQHAAAGREQVWHVPQGHGLGQGATISLEWSARALSCCCASPGQRAGPAALRAGGGRCDHGGPGHVDSSPERSELQDC